MRLLGAGDNVVDRYPHLGRYFPGGNAVNVAVAARRAGAEAAYLGALGDDEAGRTILGALAAEGVETSRVRIESGSTAWVDIRQEDGDRVFGEYDLGVSPFRLLPDDLEYAATFDLVHLCAGCFLEEDASALAMRAPLSFDFKLRRDLNYLGSLLSLTRYAFFSAADLGEAGTTDLLSQAVSLGATVAVATRGAGDSFALDAGRLHRQSPISRTPLDTLGAGDAYIGRFLVGYLGGEAISKTLRAAAEAAAATCQEYGAFGHGHPYDASGHVAHGPSLTGQPTEATAR
jgi:fructoselysine 6-kinase